LQTYSYLSENNIMKNRSRIEIFYDIIAATRASAKKTHLMYRSNLSFKQLDLYLNFLLRQKLVEERFDIETASKTYFVTEKGLEFLRLFENLRAFMGNPVEQDVEDTKFVASPIDQGETSDLIITQPLTQ
jgi:predicted transcriptional regulator